MEMIHTAALNDKQKKDILVLMEACRKYRPLSLSFPFEDGTSFYLLYSPELVCALALILPEENTSGSAAECLAFTLPEKRRQGYFSVLFAQAEAEIEDLDLFFLTDGSDEGALGALRSLEAEPDHSELRMDFLLSELPGSALKEESSRLLVQDYLTGDILTLAFCLKGEPCPGCAGLCRFVSYGKKTCFYDFEIRPELRGTGLGKEALLLALAHIKTEGMESVFLQVSGDNLTALQLYEKTGFRISETLFYYLY